MHFVPHRGQEADMILQSCPTRVKISSPLLSMDGFGIILKLPAAYVKRHQRRHSLQSWCPVLVFGALNLPIKYVPNAPNKRAESHIGLESVDRCTVPPHVTAALRGHPELAISAYSICVRIVCPILLPTSEANNVVDTVIAAVGCTDVVSSAR